MRSLLPLPLLLAACAGPGFGPIAAVPAAPQRDSRTEACRAEATRIVQFRDRGQVMRTDETESGRGTTTVAPFSRAESDRGGQQMERDRILQDCLRANPAAR